MQFTEVVQDFFDVSIFNAGSGSRGSGGSKVSESSQRGDLVWNSNGTGDFDDGAVVRRQWRS